MKYKMEKIAEAREKNETIFWGGSALETYIHH
jgi:hypothetical protein